MVALHRLGLSLMFTAFWTTSVFSQSLESQFKTFLSWWPGSFENTQGIESVVTSAEGFVPMRLFIREVEMPAFGQHVVYAEWQDARDPDRVIRQRFYGLEIDEQRQALRLNLHIFPPDPEFVAATRGAHLDPAKVAHLMPGDMVPLPGCDVYFTWTGDHFEGAMDRGACAFPAPGTETDIYSWSQMRLNETSFDYLDGWFHLDGSEYLPLQNDWYVFTRR